MRNYEILKQTACDHLEGKEGDGIMNSNTIPLRGIGYAILALAAVIAESKEKSDK